MFMLSNARMRREGFRGVSTHVVLTFPALPLWVVIDQEYFPGGTLRLGEWVRELQGARWASSYTGAGGVGGAGWYGPSLCLPE